MMAGIDQGGGMPMTAPAGKKMEGGRERERERERGGEREREREGGREGERERERGREGEREREREGARESVLAYNLHNGVHVP